MKHIALTVIAVISLGLAACTPGKPIRTSDNAFDNADFWQRSAAVESLYLNGPKAQHQLNKDIASCVAEVKELVRLGSIASAKFPKGQGGNKAQRGGYNRATRDGPLFTEFADFQDFEGCMQFKGWTRTNYVGNRQGERAQGLYNNTILSRGPGEVFVDTRHGTQDEREFNQQ